MSLPTLKCEYPECLNHARTADIERRLREVEEGTPRSVILCEEHDKMSEDPAFWKDRIEVLDQREDGSIVGIVYSDDQMASVITIPPEQIHG